MRHSINAKPWVTEVGKGPGVRLCQPCTQAPRDPGSEFPPPLFQICQSLPQPSEPHGGRICCDSHFKDQPVNSEVKGVAAQQTNELVMKGLESGGVFQPSLCGVGGDCALDTQC